MDKSKLFEIIDRVCQVNGKKLNEGMTKTSLILPFMQALGYDVFNPNEVVAEFTADVGTKNGEKVDFAILKDGEPVIMIECKAMGTPLDEGKCNQLHRYFPTHTSTRIGILTDGVIYLFFSDLEQQNIMDSRPFMEVNFKNFNERLIPEIQKLSKDMWNIESILSSASSLKYINEAKILFANELTNPSEDFIKYFASRIYNGHVTAKVREQFSSIIKRAIQAHINDLINSRLESAKIDETQHINTDTLLPKENVGEGIVTTEDEAMAYLIIQTILRQTIKPSRVFLRDAKTYCAINLDDNNRKTIIRLYFNGKSKSFGIFDSSKNEEKFQVETIDDIYSHADNIISAVKTFLASE